VFDLFGTLITSDSDEVAHEALSKALAEIHANVFDWEEHMRMYRELVGQGVSSLDATWEALLRSLHGTMSEPLVSKAELVRMHTEFHARYARLRPDAIPALKKAREFLDRVGLVTDGDGEIVYAVLEAVGILKYFDAIVTFNDCHVRKPDPCLFLTCLRKLSVRPENAVMIGDRCADVEGSTKVGMKAVLLGSSKYCNVKPHAEANDLLEAVDHALILLGIR